MNLKADLSVVMSSKTVLHGGGRMSFWAGVRVSVGTRVMFDGEIHEVIEWIPSTAGTEVVLKSAIGLRRMSIVALVSDPRVD